jgi:hypothetical protein
MPGKNRTYVHAKPLQNDLRKLLPRKGSLALTSAVFSALLLPSLPAQAGATISSGEDQSVSVGFGLRTSFTSAEDGAPDGDGRSKDFQLDSIRLYMGAQLNKYIKATFNTEKQSDGSIQVIDAIAQFEPMDEFNVWMGQMLPPSDRSNLDGPYYMLAWNYPGLVSGYPNYAVGRDKGLLAWGKVFDKKMVYSVGAFEGHNNQVGLSSESDNLLYAGRLAFNLWDPELAPAYYTGSTYFGAANIFTIGLVAQHQSDGVGTAANKGDYNAYNIDVLFETKDTGSGSLTLEGAYYKTDTDDTVDASDGSKNTGGLTQGKSYLLGAAYLFPQQVGLGKFQPYVRFLKFDRDKVVGVGSSSVPQQFAGDFKQYDIGVNYVIAGPNAKISATYTEYKADDDGASSNDDTNAFVLGVQLQF